MDVIEIIMKNRIDIIKDIEKARSSKLLTLFLGDRSPFATKIADDSLPLIHKHLHKMGKRNKISLFLYTSGGQMTTPLRIINLLREYCAELEVLVPQKAHSAGTLLCLGVDTIVMSAMGELSPIDPSTIHPFNPIDPKENRNKDISVEDVNSYFLFAEEKLGLDSKEDKAKTFELLVKELHPLALGNIYRGQRMANLLASKLLNSHKTKFISKGNSEKVVKKLTTDIPIHAYPISRVEAKNFGLNIETPSTKLEELLLGLYNQYAYLLELDVPYNPQYELGENKQIQSKKYGAIIESGDDKDVFVFNVSIAQSVAPNGLPLPSLNISTSWSDKENV